MRQKPPPHLIEHIGKLKGTVHDLSALTGIPVTTFRGWVQNKVIVADGPRSQYFDLAKNITAIVAHSAGRGSSRSLSSEREAFTRTKRELAQLELKQKAGKMIEVDTAIRHAVAVEALTKARLLGIASKAAGRCANRDPAAIEVILRAEIEEALAMLARLSDLGGDLDEEPEPEPEPTEAEGAEHTLGAP